MNGKSRIGLSIAGMLAFIALSGAYAIAQVKSADRVSVNQTATIASCVIGGLVMVSVVGLIVFNILAQCDMKNRRYP